MQMPLFYLTVVKASVMVGFPCSFGAYGESAEVYGNRSPSLIEAKGGRQGCGPIIKGLPPVAGTLSRKLHILGSASSH